MSKLTLSVDAKVVARAKRYAKKNGVSVSEIVESYLDVVTDKPKVKRPPPKTDDLPPILRSLKGSLKGTNPEEEYKKYRIAKYG